MEFSIARANVSNQVKRCMRMGDKNFDGKINNQKEAQEAYNKCPATHRPALKKFLKAKGFSVKEIKGTQKVEPKLTLIKVQGYYYTFGGIQVIDRADNWKLVKGKSNGWAGLGVNNEDDPSKRKWIIQGGQKLVIEFKEVKNLPSRICFEINNSEVGGWIDRSNLLAKIKSGKGKVVIDIDQEIAGNGIKKIQFKIAPNENVRFEVRFSIGQ